LGQVPTASHRFFAMARPNILPRNPRSSKAIRRSLHGRQTATIWGSGAVRGLWSVGIGCRSQVSRPRPGPTRSLQIRNLEPIDQLAQRARLSVSRTEVYHPSAASLGCNPPNANGLRRWVSPTLQPSTGLVQQTLNESYRDFPTRVPRVFSDWHNPCHPTIMALFGRSTRFPMGGPQESRE
jgi:hypothetical protein